jgi:hypothetical protein
MKEEKSPDGYGRNWTLYSGGRNLRMAKKIIIKALNFYKKYISYVFIGSCRFHPTCSEYARQAVERYGPLKGLLMALWRVLRCNPFSRGGYDPVIKKQEEG